MNICKLCSGVVGYMGRLGNRYHYLCRNCGASTSSLTPLTEETDSDQEIENAGMHEGPRG